MTEDEEKKLTEKQQRVLDAALEMFAERGYAGVATNEIAKRAGVAEGTIFKTWKTKKDLLLAVMAPVFLRLMAPRLVGDMKSVFEQPWDDAESLLRAFFVNRLEFVRDHHKVLRVMMQELPFHDEVRGLVKAKMLADLWPSVKGAIERLQAKGELNPDVPPHAIARTMVGSFMSFLALRYIFHAEGQWDDEKEHEWLLQLLLNGVRPRVPR